MVGRWLTYHSTILPAVVLLATVSTAEPLALWPHIDHLDAHIAYVGVAIVGLTFPLLFFRRRWSQAVRAVFLTAALTYPAAVVLEATLIALGQISSPMRLLWGLCDQGDHATHDPSDRWKGSSALRSWIQTPLTSPTAPTKANDVPSRFQNDTDWAY